MSRELHIQSADGVRHTARVFAAAAPQAPVILCLPAMGAASEYYRPLAERVAAEGLATAVLLDLRGQGLSSARARKGDQFGYREMLELDLPQAVATLRSVFRGRPLFVLGHSLGGQLGLLLAGRLKEGIAGLVLVAAGTAYHRDWPRQGRLQANLITFLIRLASRLLPWYPGRQLGFGGEQPRQLMRDWSLVARRGEYRPEGSDFDYEAAARTLRLPILAIGVRGDPVAPESAREALLRRAPQAGVTRVEIDGVRRHGAWKRHFSWAREPGQTVDALGRWLAQLA